MYNIPYVLDQNLSRGGVCCVNKRDNFVIRMWGVLNVFVF